MPANKNQRRSKKYGFQKGRINENKGIKRLSDSQNVSSHKFIRLTKESFDSRVNIHVGEKKTYLPVKMLMVRTIM